MKWIIFSILVSVVVGCSKSDSEKEEISPMSNQELATEIKQHLTNSYPDIRVEVKPWDQDPSRFAIYFTEEKFKVLYPQQRYHYLIHLIPDDFFKQHLSNSVWFELAPGEDPEDLEYPDNELMKDISPDVLNLLNKSKFFSALDDQMSPIDSSVEPKVCHGDFRLTKRILTEKGFKEQGAINEIFDICHVLMEEGAFCDCEVLLNVAEVSRLRENEWKKRAEQESAQPEP